MRSPVTALILLSLLVACSETGDIPTSPQSTDTPQFSIGGGDCPSGHVDGSESFLCGRTHNVFFRQGDPLGLNTAAL